MRMMMSYDIITLTETHLHGDARLRAIMPQGSQVFTLDGAGRKGGVALWVSARMLDKVELLGMSQLPRGSQSIWIRVRGDSLALGGKGLVVGACYAAPSGSKCYARPRVQAGIARTPGERVFGKIRALINRFCTPSDELLLMGDMNARVANQQEILGSEADEEIAAHTGTHVPSLLASIPERRSKDTAHGHAHGQLLVNMCRELGLCILNGRVDGDMDGEYTFSGGAGKSMIDLCITTPALYFKARHLEVCSIPEGEDAEKLGLLLSDHCPVTLTLAVGRWGPAAIRRGGRPRFDVRKSGAYAAIFQDSECAELRKIAEVMCRLGLSSAAGGLTSTDAVERLGKVLYRAMDRAFGRGITDTRRVRGQEDAPWWTEDLANARTEMLGHKAQMRATGTLHDDAARAEFSRLRTRYQRMRREARERHKIAHFTQFLDECKADPRALWQRLNDGIVPPCPLTSVADWASFFDTLYNGAFNAFDSVTADEILSLINRRAGTGQRRWVQETGDLTEADARRTRVVAAAALNIPFTLSEVETAIQCLKNHKSGGLDRVPAECYKYATREIEDGKTFNVLAPFLLALFEHIRVSGDYPRQFCETSLTPIHKKGDVSDMSNYRGLAVGGALAKCYAFLLEQRLSTWGESCDARCAFQGGFRRKRGTIHNLFVLRHLTDRYRSLQLGRGQALFVCQIDFEKAFDRVPRELLWQRLEERGVHGPMLQALKKAYEKVMLRVRVDGRTGDPFESTAGVKQGCPLSPTLFGLFIEAYADYLAAKDALAPDIMAAGDSPTVDGQRLPLLFYADDLSLFATTHRRLLQMLTTLREYCEAFGMKVNVTKSEVLGMHASATFRRYVRQEPSPLPVYMREYQQGLPVLRFFPWKRRARYLGLYYSPSTKFESCCKELRASGERAMHALRRKLRKKGLLVPAVAMRCFDAQVRAVLSYGAQIWAPDALLRVFHAAPTEGQRYGAFDRAIEHGMVRIQMDFMREVVGAQKPTHELLFRELGCMPLHVHWAELVFRFWNQLVKAQGTIYHQAFREEIRAVLSNLPSPPTHTWGAKVLRLLMVGLGYRFGGDEGDLEARITRITTHELDVSALMGTIRERFEEDWRSSRLGADPRAFVTQDGVKPGVKMCRYKHWMGEPRHTQIYIPRAWHTSMMRFRLGVWMIEANNPRGVSGAHRERSERLCPLCLASGSSHVEDERHVLLECGAYDDIRSTLYGEEAVPTDMAKVMAWRDQRGLARAIHAIRLRRNDLTARPI